MRQAGDNSCTEQTNDTCAYLEDTITEVFLLHLTHYEVKIKTASTIF